MTALVGIDPRFRELGRIRLGQKGAKGAPQRLSTFRLTSPSRVLIEDAAERYGGTTRPWEDGYEVVTETAELDVMIPPAAQSLTQQFELWSRDGRQRLCDGRTDYDNAKPCQCPADLNERATLATQGKACSPVTRLNVLLPDLPGLGVWCLVTRGRNAAAELAGLAPILRRAMASGVMFRCVLRIEARSSKRPGEARHDFVVPVLDVPVRVGLLLDSLGVESSLGVGAPEPALGEVRGLPSATEANEHSAVVAGRPTPSDPDDDDETAAPEPEPEPRRKLPTARPELVPEPDVDPDTGEVLDAIRPATVARVQARLNALGTAPETIAAHLARTYAAESVRGLSEAQGADFLAALGEHGERVFS